MRLQAKGPPDEGDRPVTQAGRLRQRPGAPVGRSVRGDLSAREEARARMQLYALVLDMLDRLDAWDTYLEVWHQLRQHTAYTVEYRGGAATLPRSPIG